MLYLAFLRLNSSVLCGLKVYYRKHIICYIFSVFFKFVLYIFAGNLSTSVALAERSCQLTTAPDYLLKSSLLTKRDDRLIDISNTALWWQEPSEYKGLKCPEQVCKSWNQDGRGGKFSKTEIPLLKSQLASCLTENRLLTQLSVPCLSSSGTTQLHRLGMKHSLSSLENADVSQNMSQYCVTPSSISATNATFGGTRASPVMSSVPVDTKNTVVESKHVIKRKAVDTKTTSLAEKRKPKPVKKVKLAVPEQADDDSVSSFELPEYQLTHECMESEKVELFVSTEIEQMREQLMRPVVDVPSIKVATWLL